MKWNKGDLIVLFMCALVTASIIAAGIFLFRHYVQTEAQRDKDYSIAWDLLESDRVRYGIDRHYVCIDVSCGFMSPLPVVLKDTMVTASSYLVQIPALPEGVHTARVQSCSETKCYEAISMSFMVDVHGNGVVSIRELQ